MKGPAMLVLAVALLGGCGRGTQSNAPAPAAASTAPSSTASSTAAPQAGDGDAAVGERIATGGIPNHKVAPCTSCHGAHGEGNAAAGFPRLAGQPQAYLLHQLQAYADGSRANAVMTPIAQGLQDAQRRDLAAFFSTQAPATQSPTATTAPGPARGEALAVSGDDALHVQACANCHGPQGIGEAPTYPALAGQGSVYLVSALKAWKDGSRRTDPSQQMPAIARALPDADIEAIAQYYAALPAPPSASTASSTKPSATSSRTGPRGNGASAQGIGVEQGSPTTGGGEGPGGGGGTQGPQPQQNGAPGGQPSPPPRPMGKR